MTEDNITPLGEAEMRGRLAAALAKAQAKFPPIPRTRTVTVRSQTGNSYTFDYAPLDVVLDSVRPALAENGLAVTQLFQQKGLLTMLMHESGGVLESWIDIPQAEKLQTLGGSITYLRRYAMLAILGIAAEEDTDGGAEGTQSVKARNEGEAELTNKLRAIRAKSKPATPAVVPDPPPQTVSGPASVIPASYQDDSLEAKNAGRAKAFGLINQLVALKVQDPAMAENTEKGRTMRGKLWSAILKTTTIPVTNELTAVQWATINGALQNHLDKWIHAQKPAGSSEDDNPLIA